MVPFVKLTASPLLPGDGGRSVAAELPALLLLLLLDVKGKGVTDWQEARKRKDVKRHHNVII